MKVICLKRKQKYFFAKGWTGRNSLIEFKKFDFTAQKSGLLRALRSSQ